MAQNEFSDSRILLIVVSPVILITMIAVLATILLRRRRARILKQNLNLGVAQIGDEAKLGSQHFENTNNGHEFSSDGGSRFVEAGLADGEASKV